MTLRERVEHFTKRVLEKPEDAAALIEQALREELKDVALTLKASADQKVKMYKELGLNGEDQARPYREIAEAVQRRSEL